MFRLNIQEFIETRMNCYDPCIGASDFGHSGGSSRRSDNSNNNKTNLREGFNKHSVECPNGVVVTIKEDGDVSISRPFNGVQQEVPPKKEVLPQDSDHSDQGLCSRIVKSLSRLIP